MQSIANFADCRDASLPPPFFIQLPLVGVTGIRPAVVGALEKYSDIVTVDAGDGKHKYCWNWGDGLSSYWQRSTDTCAGRALLAKF